MNKIGVTLTIHRLCTLREAEQTDTIVSTVL